MCQTLKEFVFTREIQTTIQKGCILIGQTRSNDFIGSSRNAFNELYKKIKNEKKTLKITIE
jgi:hypothetical protein